MKRSVPIAVALAALVLVGALAIHSIGGRPHPRSALIVTLDTTRADALGCYAADSSRRSASPSLDARANESVLYLAARTTAPITLPAHASMMTGLYPPRHAARDNSRNAVPGAARTLAEIARAAGLETAAFVAAAVLDPSVGLAQGFDVYDGIERAPGDFSVHFAERRAADVLRSARRWFDERDDDRPFLAWVHLFDPHFPYDAPRPMSAQFSDPYRAEVATADAAVGELFDLLAAKGLLDETLVIVVGDHGESLGEHGEPSHGVLCYDATIRVPFLVRHPDGHRAGERSDETVSVVDVFPTVLDALDLDAAADVDGVSLWDARVQKDRGVYFESYYGFLHYGWRPIAGWADRSATYLHGAEPELRPATAAPAAYRAAIDAVFARSALAPDAAIDSELANELAALGYATAGGAATELPHPLAPLELPDARTRTGELAQTLTAIQRGERGDRRAAIETLATIVDRNPRNLQALDQLGTFLMAERRWDEAVDALERLLASAESATAHNNLAWSLTQAGRGADACRHYERALELAPTEPRIATNYAELLAALGRDAEARAMAERARALE